MTFDPKTYQLQEHTDLRDLWLKAEDEVTPDEPLSVFVTTKREAYSLRQSLYRYRKAMASGHDPSIWMRLTLQLEESEEGWFVVFNRQPVYTLLPHRNGDSPE